MSTALISLILLVKGAATNKKKNKKTNKKKNKKNKKIKLILPDASPSANESFKIYLI